MNKTNGSNVEKAALDCIRLIEIAHKQLDMQKIDNMNACKLIREGMKQVYADAKNLGVNTMAVKTLVKVRRLKQQITVIEESQDPDQLDDYEAYDFATTPLGKTARPETELET